MSKQNEYRSKFQVAIDYVACPEGWELDDVITAEIETTRAYVIGQKVREHFDPKPCDVLETICAPD